MDLCYLNIDIKQNRLFAIRAKKSGNIQSIYKPIDLAGEARQITWEIFRYSSHLEVSRVIYY